MQPYQKRPVLSCRTRDELHNLTILNGLRPSARSGMQCVPMPAYSWKYTLTGVTKFGAWELATGCSVEQFLKEALLALAPWMTVRGITSAISKVVRRRCRLCRCPRGGGLRTTFDDLVQLPAVEPDAPTCGAIVDLDARTFAHNQGGSIHWAGHPAICCTHLLCPFTGSRPVKW